MKCARDNFPDLMTNNRQGTTKGLYSIDFAEKLKIPGQNIYQIEKTRTGALRVLFLIYSFNLADNQIPFQKPCLKIKQH